MIERDDDLEEAVENWLNSKNTQKDSREELISILQSKLEIYNLTELETLTGIKRTTLYYMIFGKEGKSGQIGNA